MIDTQTRLSPGWWFDRLAKKLQVQAAHCEYLDRYYRNEAGAPLTTTKAVREAYQRLRSLSRSNYPELIVEPVRERMQPVGFRTGATGDDLGDSEAWDIFQANNLDADSGLVHTLPLSMGLGFVIVGGVDPEIGQPLVTAEDPRQVVVETDPRRRRRVVAALKMFRDDTLGADVAYLYLVDERGAFVARAIRKVPVETGTEPIADVSGFSWVSGDRLPGMPVVPFVNKPDVAGHGHAEFESAIPILDRINYSILQQLEIATMQAFRQRGIKGVPRTDENGLEINYDDIFAADPGALWLLPEAADIWESGQVDLGPLLKGTSDYVQQMAATTRTPMFYISPDAANGSAEGASLAREGLTFKTKARLIEYGESWEQVMSLAFLFKGDTERANRRAMEIIWAPPERYSLAEQADASSKASGLSRRKQLEIIWGLTPQQINENERELTREALTAPLDEPVTA